MAEFRAVFDLTKLMRDLEKEMKGQSRRLLEGMTTREKLFIGDELADEMRSTIAKGISPIKDKGRFPEYVGVTKLRKVKKVSKSLTGSRKTKAKSKIKKLQNRAYPYSVQDKFPGKKARPVNLFLSGKFLKNLIARVSGKTLEIGFFDEPWTDYEQGHREGANGQAKRPIIPNGREQFSTSVYRRLVKAVQSVLNKKK